LARYKFGVFLPFYAFKAETPNEYYNHLKTIVLQCEHLGYDSVWLDDHLMYGAFPILETWTTLSALASLTTTIRLGTMVSCIQHRNPALLAKAAATLDVLSNGRLEFGIGAGVQEAEHTAYGFGFPKANTRIEQLGEALEVITRLWTQEKASFQGKHYTLKNAICVPNPLQKPHPPIIVGGSGKNTLNVTARFADKFDWGFVPSTDLYKRSLNTLNQECKTVGRDFDRIEKSAWPAGQLLVANDKTELDSKVAMAKPANMPLEDFKKFTLSGTPNQCLERLRVYSALGVTYFMLYFADLPSNDSIRLFAGEVIGKV